MRNSFKKVQVVQKIELHYLSDEYSKQKIMYLSEKYTLDKNERKTYLTQPNTLCSKNASTLIWEKNQ